MGGVCPDPAVCLLRVVVCLSLRTLSTLVVLVCVVVVVLKDVEEAMNIRLGCRCFDFLFLFLVDT